MKYLLEETFMEYLEKNNSWNDYVFDRMKKAYKQLKCQNDAIEEEIMDLRAIGKYVYVKNHFMRVGSKIRIENLEAAELTLDEFVDMFINEHPESREAYNQLVSMLI